MPNKAQTGIRLALCAKSQPLRRLLDAKINSVKVRVIRAGERITIARLVTAAANFSSIRKTKATTTNTLPAELLPGVDADWHAANYLTVGPLGLDDHPLRKRPLAPADGNRMLLGPWGTPPGQNFIYAHLNRLIKKYDFDMIYVASPGHGGPAA